MSKASYLIPAEQGQVTLEIKRSKFITFASIAENRAQAESFIADLRAQHPQANHVCWAYIAGSPDTTVRSMSDDGEPSGTAGMPMLKVLEHSGYGNIVVAVVRYFGGTKLGTGGLQRAYSEAVALVLNDLLTQLRVERTQIKLTYEYHYQGSISRLLERYDIDNLNADYQDQITATLALASSQLDEFTTEITNITAGNIQIAPIKAIQI
jgi:uncharacterized YigZ family protein